MVGTTGTGPDERTAGRLSEVLVTLARLVLAGDDTDWIARETVLNVATALDADRCEVLRPAPGGKRLLWVASCGEDPGRGGRSWSATATPATTTSPGSSPASRTPTASAARPARAGGR